MIRRNTGRVGSTGNRTLATVSLIHLFIRLQAACRFLRSEQKNHQLDERFLIHLRGKCSVASGMDRMSRVRKGGGSREGNDKTGPYGEKGGWSNGRSVSALHRVGQNRNTL